MADSSRERTRTGYARPFLYLWRRDGCWWWYCQTKLGERIAIDPVSALSQRLAVARCLGHQVAESVRVGAEC